MSDFFLDTSALVKRYIYEQGTDWVLALTGPKTSDTIVIAEVTEVEAAAAISAKHRASSGITQQARDEAIALLRVHRAKEYRTVPITRPILNRAISLTQHYRLRGYDAIQLATALMVQDLVVSHGFLGVTFVTSDHDLIVAAKQEGLSTDNPNLYC